MSEKGEVNTIYIDNNQQIIHHFVQSYNLKDTSISGTVLYPDPLSSVVNFTESIFLIIMMKQIAI